MRTSAIFQPKAPAVERLVADHPLAQVISWDGEGIAATPLPLLASSFDGTNGEITEFIGHFGRTNPQLDIIRKRPRSLLIFLGPHGYVSPSWMEDRTQAPTWNFATAHFLVDIELLESADDARMAVDRLTDQMERGRKNAWHPDEMGKRYEMLVKGVIAFRARVVGTSVKFKLGQNEREDVLADIIEGLKAEPQEALVNMMIDHQRTEPSERSSAGHA